MSRPTIIHIAPSSPKENDPEVFHQERTIGSWATSFVKEFLHHSDEFELEVWSQYCSRTFENAGDKVLSESSGGITFRLFPTRKVGPANYISFPLLKELKRRAATDEKILVHLQSVHSLLTYLISRACKHVPLVGQQRGPNSFPMWRFRFHKNPFYLFSSLLNHLTIRNFDFVFACSVGETDYLKKKLGPDRVLHQKGGGFDFDQYIPRPKEELRKELGLPLDKKIMIHVGRFTKLKGIDHIIQMYENLKKKYDIEMLFIGGNKDQAFFDKVVASGAMVKGFIPRDEVIKYINASDVYLMPSFDEEFIPFGGIGTAPLEALAMNVPVVSPLMMNFMGTKEELSQIAKVSVSRSELESDIEEILQNPSRFSNTREIVMKYYRWETIISSTIRVYKELLNEYYGGMT